MMNVHPRLASFASHPPTPPRQRSNDKAKSVFDNIHLADITHDLFPNTPNDSPSSSAEKCGDSSERGSKRVGFSPWTKYHKPPSNNSKSYGLDDQMKILPPSKDCKSSKSILKRHSNASTPRPASDLPPLGLGGDSLVMLESTLQHLESHSRTSRVDAYSALLGCLSAYDDVPGPEALSQRLSDLLNYIRRDIFAKNEGAESLDTQLVSQALKLLMVFVSTSGLAGSIPEDFYSFIVEQSISSLEDRAMPKILVIHYMQLLMQESFSNQHMQTDRANRLMLALDGVVSKIKGNRIVGQRLMVYKRLLTQTKSTMVTCAETWVDHLISGMLSTFKEIRFRAIVFGAEASLLLGTIRSVSQVFVDTLNRESPEGRKVVDFLASRLTEMTDDKDEGIHVPQIWSIVILFLRGRKRQLEAWEHLKPWLFIIQKCFNSSDAKIKYQANLAWNRLIFTINLDSSTSSSMIKMLRQPIVTQLERRIDLKASKPSKNARQIARSSYCTLLYYAFRPSATHAQCDQYWEEYVSQTLPSSPSNSDPDLSHSCNILAALFSSKQPKVWDENRANTNCPITPEELPCLDPKWIRIRAPVILTVFEKLFQTAVWQPEKKIDSPILIAWRSFGTAIGEASSKEVKTSMETMTAIAHILNAIKRFWQQDLQKKSGQEVSYLIEKVDCLFSEAASKIGTIPFNEKRLTQSFQNSYEAAETPSGRSNRQQGPLRSPVLSFLSLLASSLEDHQITKNYTDIVEQLVNTSICSTATRRTQIGILQDFTHLLSFGSRPDSKAKRILWQHIAKAAASAFVSSKANDAHDDSPPSIGHDYRDAVKILDVAWSLRSTEAIMEWKSLGNTLIHSLVEEVGTDGVTIILTEPLAASICRLHPIQCDDFLIESAVFLLRTARWPQSRKATERTRKLLWGVTSMPTKSNSIDLLDKLYLMANSLLSTSYTALKSITSSLVADLISAITSLISSCSSSLKVDFVKQIHPGAALWIKDDKGLVSISGPGDGLPNLELAVKHLWEAISSVIETIPNKDSKALLVFETLIAAGLGSRQKSILKQSVLFWNRTFGKSEGLEYPEAIQPILSELRSLTHIYLPNFPETDDTDVIPNSIQLLNSQIDEEEFQPDIRTTLNNSQSKSAHERSEEHVAHLSASPASLMPQAFSRASPELSGVERIIRTTPKKAHLSHGDSRIEFAAIESSPLASEDTSSQLLTSRQEEVREPQELEASAMFPNFDPLTRTNRANSERPLPKLSLKGISSSQSRSGAGTESPMLSNDDILTDFFGSSPTPRSSSRSLRIRPVDIELSPSPSKQPKSVSMPQAISTPTTTLSRTAHDKAEDCSEGSNHSHLQQCQKLNDKDFQTSRESLHQLINPLLETPLGEPTFVDNRIRAGSTYGSDDDLKDTNVLFEIDAFIDAQSAPLPTSECDILEQMEGSIQISSFSPEQIFDSANESVSKSGIQEHRNRYTQDKSVEEAPGVIHSRESSDLNSVIGSFHKMDSRHIPSEEDQITAQLVSDLERASSQAETDMSVSSSPIKCLISASNKRKCTFNGIQRGTKKPKTQPGFHIIVETRNPEVSENGCSSVQKDHRPETKSPAIGQEQESQLRNTRATNKRSSVKTATRRSKRFSNTNSFSTPDSQATSEEASVTSIKEEPEIIYDIKNTADPHVAPRRQSVRLRELSKPNQGSQGNSEYHKPENVHVSTENEGRPNERKGSEDMVQQSIEKEEEDEEVTSSYRERDDPPAQDTVRHESFATVHELLTGMTGVDDYVEAAPTSPLKTPEPTDPGNVAATNTAHLQEERDLAGATAASGPAEQGKKATASGILTEYRALLGTLRQVELGDEDEGEMIRLLCDSLQAVHEAGRRKRGV